MEKFKKLLSNNLFLYICVGLIVVLLALCQWVITFSSDACLDDLVRQTVTEGLVGIIVVFSFYAVGARLVDRSVKKTEYLWALPCFAVAVANFPFSALIGGQAQIVYPGYIWLLIVKCLVVGLSEEMFFRGTVLTLLISKLDGKRKNLLSVLVSAAIFALWHLLNLFGGADPLNTLIQVIYTFLLGCMLAVLTMKTGNILLGVTIHGFFNFGGQIVAELGRGPFQDKIFWIATFIGAVLATVATVKMFLSIKDKNFRPEEKN